MKYMGGKGKLAKHILPLILKERNQEQYYVELFGGGLNLIDNVKGNRIANDANFYLIEMWKELIYGEWKPKYISKEIYNHIKNNRDLYPPFLVGYAGFNLSYSGKYFGGFAGVVETKIGTVRDYQTEAIKNITKQLENLKGIELRNQQYFDVDIPPNSIVYCDPPYENTEGYSNKINHNDFWQYCRYLKYKGHAVFVSEYKAPPDFKTIWEMDFKSSLAANGKHSGTKTRTEKLFTL